MRKKMYSVSRHFSWIVVTVFEDQISLTKALISCLRIGFVKGEKSSGSGGFLFSLSKTAKQSWLVAEGFSVVVQMWPPIVCGNPSAIGQSKYKVGLPQSQWIIGWYDRWEFPPIVRGHWQSPCTALTAGNLPAIRAVQGDWKSRSLSGPNVCMLQTRIHFIDTPGGHVNKDFYIEIIVIMFCFYPKSNKWSLQNFAHATTACAKICSDCLDTSGNTAKWIVTKFAFWWKIVSKLGPRGP